MDAGTFDRRSALKVGGSLFAGLAVGSVPTAAADAGRFLLKPKSNAGLGGLTVEEELPALEYVAVSGSEREAKKRSTAYAPDPTLEPTRPAVGTETASPRGAAEARDEPLYDLQWDKQDLDVPEAQNVTRGEGVRVSIVDSGIAADLPDLDDVNLDLSEDFSGDGLGVGAPYGGYHGTHVSGIVAATDANDRGVVGTAPGAELVDCRVFSHGGGAPFSVVLAALLHSVEVDSDVTNVSLGAYSPRSDYVDDGRFGRFYGRLLNRTLTHAKREGTLVVMSAGNNGADLQHDKRWLSLPNEGAQGLSVAATGPIGFEWGAEGTREPYQSPAFYTNYGTNAVDLAAPGGDADQSAIGTDVPWHRDLVLSTVATFERDEDGEILADDPTYGWDWAAGTSMAAPNVSGAAALVKANNPEFGPARVVSALERTAEVPEGYDKAYYGAGYLNVVDAL